jgi:hypothetical protein
LFLDSCQLFSAPSLHLITHPHPHSTRNPQDEVAAELACGKCFIQGTGPGGTGRPLFVVLVARHSKTASDADAATMKRFVCWCLDTAAAASDPALNPSITGLFDFRGVSLDSLDIVALRQIFGMLQTHFPERLERVVMYAAPRLFNALWRVLQPFLDAKTKSKIVFVGEGGAVAALPGVPLSILPREYGGSAEKVPIDVAAAAVRARGVGVGGASGERCAEPARPPSGASASSVATAVGLAAAAPQDDDDDTMCEASEVAELQALAAAEMAHEAEEEGGGDGCEPAMLCLT